MYRVTLAHGELTVAVPFLAERLVLGSGPDADIRLPVRQVSRRHAELVRDGARFVIRDLDSRNGTFVRGARVEQAELETLVEFSLGPVVGMIEEVSTTDLETALSVAQPQRGSLEPEPAHTRTDRLDTHRHVLESLIAPAVTALIQGEEALPLLRRGGALLADMVPGLELELVREGTDGSTVLFATGTIAGEATPHSVCLDTQAGRDATVHARWQVPTAMPPDAVAQAVGFLAAVAAAANDVAGTEGATSQLPQPPPTRIVGSSAAMRGLLDYVRRLAPTPINLFILGESGTGKELLAREIHERSRRTDGPFVALNCAALPRDLLEAELFGIEEKVATGVAARTGRFEQAHTGTLFLDEVCDTCLHTQAMMLRVLEEQSFYRIGGTRARPADVRVVAATNKDVREQIAGGRFRSDLYYRLAGDTLEVPPLRDRIEDVPILVHHFLERFTRTIGRPVAGVSKKALEALLRHGWPGNVRELENEVRRLVALAPAGGLIEAAHLSPAVLNPVQDRGAATEAGLGLADELARTERRLIQHALTMEQGNMAATARRLGISRPGLYQRMARLDIESPGTAGSG